MMTFKNIWERVETYTPECLDIPKRACVTSLEYNFNKQENF